MLGLVGTDRESPRELHRPSVRQDADAEAQVASVVHHLYAGALVVLSMLGVVYETVTSA